MNELPRDLKDQILKKTHAELINSVIFFKSKAQHFTHAVVPQLKNLNLKPAEVLYQ
jgi:hypothetical protein